jgi:steroid 5-alpha reductase family enzyme
VLFDFDPHNIITTLLASLAIQAIFFAFAASFKTDKVTDLSYSLSFALLALFQVFSNRAFAPGQIIVATFVVIWAARLGAYLLSRIIKIGKDARFDDKRGDFAKFLRFWTLQALAVWLVMLPATIYLSFPAVGGIGAPSIAGAALMALGLGIEALSDAQKYAFKNDPANAGLWIGSGLWKYSRHPNYLGEVLLWWGVFLFVLPSLRGFLLLSVLGPISITLLILFVSGVPLLERSADAKHGGKGEYQAYKRRTSVFLLLPPKKG